MRGGTLLPVLAAATDAEDFFAALDVPCDAAVLAAHRLVIMRRFGLEAAARLDGQADGDEATRRDIVRDALASAYAACCERGSGRARELWGPAPVRLGLPRRGAGG